MEDVERGVQGPHLLGPSLWAPLPAIPHHSPPSRGVTYLPAPDPRAHPHSGTVLLEKQALLGVSRFSSERSYVVLQAPKSATANQICSLPTTLLPGRGQSVALGFIISFTSNERLLCL